MAEVGRWSGEVVLETEHLLLRPWRVAEAGIHRELWLEKVFSLVEPEDVRWIFLSHDDGDHTGGLLDALDRCPNATLVGNFFLVERLALEMDLPLHRIRALDHGESFEAGDRTLRLFRPPIFDGPTTRGLYDACTATMWIVDSFASMVTGPATTSPSTPTSHTARPGSNTVAGSSVSGKRVQSPFRPCGFLSLPTTRWRAADIRPRSA